MSVITNIPVIVEDTAENPRAVIGGNGPPPNEPTPFERVSKKITCLFEEASLWLDGQPITTQGQADDIANLKRMIQEAGKEADEERKRENEPFDTGKAEVQARYAPLIADTKSVKGKVVLATDACNKALGPWLKKQKAEQDAKSAEDRRIADEKMAAAEAAIRARDAANLEQAAAAEAMLKDAKKAEAAASRAEKTTAGAGGSVGRKAGLRAVWTATMTNSAEALKHYKATKPEALKAFLLSLAEADVRAGTRSIPGFSITDEQKVV